ncbi:MAG: phage recombination protein Bet [Ruminococcus sp.]|nr:phage recombination protein Bet [Ruminococcus sp.]
MVKNQIQNTKPAKDFECVYMAGSEEIRLTPDFVTKYLVSGDASKVTLQEVVMFINLCKYQHLNPFLREAYLIKFGNQPASNVIGKSALEKRAFRNERYRGFKAGIIVLTPNGEVINRTGTFHLESEQIVGGWCDVFVEGLETVSVTVSFSEYVVMKDGHPNKQWSAKPATMIRKVAKMQALREAFPEDFAGIYCAEEVGFSEPTENAVEPPETPPEKPPVIEPPPEKPASAETSETPESYDNSDLFSRIMEGYES